MNQTIAFIWENYEFGGCYKQTLLLYGINSKKFEKKNYNFHE